MRTSLVYFFILLFFLLLCMAFFHASAQKITKIQILNSNSLEYDEIKGSQVRRLIGNVIFKHDSVYLYCDSAYMYSDKNSIDAFSNVHIIEGDSLNIFSDLLKYNGNTKKAEFHQNVRMTDKIMTLTTQRLDYQMNSKIAYYPNDGKIVDPENILTSKKGYYYAEFKTLFFKDSVKLVNKNYTMYSDTLKYNIPNKIAYFHGPTKIVSDNNTILCNYGWYDTEKELSQFNNHATLLSEKQILKADSLFYNRNKAMGKAFNNITLIDTSKDMILKGEYSEFYEKNDSTWLTGNSLLIQLMDDDSLFMHSDTFKTFNDSMGKGRVLFAYHHVKAFKKDLQAACDSLVYSFYDSTMRFYKDPVLWSDENQLTAKHITMHLNNERMDSLKLYEDAFITSEVDSSQYNQVRGKNMTGFFKNNELNKMLVNGNGQSIYYAQEENETKDVAGINKADCSNMMILFTERKAHKITFLTQPNAILYPPDKFPPEELYLKGFNWQSGRRPLKKEEIFVH